MKGRKGRSNKEETRIGCEGRRSGGYKNEGGGKKEKGRINQGGKWKGVGR